LASYDDNIGAWVVDSGEYDFIIGSSVSDKRGNVTITLP
jgi:hypothetical protein